MGVPGVAHSSQHQAPWLASRAPVCTAAGMRLWEGHVPTLGGVGKVLPQPSLGIRVPWNPHPAKFVGQEDHRLGISLLHSPSA